MRERPIITLLTDFGLSDGYVAATKGVILSICPNATLVDVSHDIGHHDVRQGAYVLGSVRRFFPEGTVHVAVVDPGVGAERRAIAVEADGQRFVAPDNGLLTSVLVEGDYNAVALNRPAYWRTSDPSVTFHGRDIFAPVAAHLALGIPLIDVGSSVDDLLLFDVEAPIKGSDGAMIGRVAHVDDFGNVITNIPSDWFSQDKDWMCEVGGVSISVSSGSYASVPRGSLLALLASHGHLEVAVRESSAAERLGIRAGDQVKVKARRPDASTR